MRISINRKTIYYIIVVAVVIAGYFAYTNRPINIVNLGLIGGPIVAFGDSLVQGVGASDVSNNFVSLLSRDIGEDIINLGVSGNTTRDGLERLDDVIEIKPRIVILLLGGNDFLKKIPQDETFANLRSIVERIQNTGASVLLLGVRGGLLYDSYDKRFKAFAKENGTGFVPNVLDGLIGEKKYMYDSVHPNDTGYEMIARKIYPYLIKMAQVE